MTDWNSPEELERVSSIFKKLIYILFGIYAWEILNTMHVEKALVLRIRSFRWPQILYFLCRYTLLLALIGLLIALSVTTQTDCQALFVFIQWAGNTTIGASTSLLLIRTIAVWNRSPYIIAPMLLLAVGQWGLLYYSVTSVKAEWAPQFGECVVTGASPAVLKSLYVYTMAFDLVILVMTISGLWFIVPGGRGGLWQMLFTDGIAYFTLVVSVNAIPAVLNVLDLNASMNVIATVPACVTSTIAATRLFRRLQDYTSKDVYVHSTSFMGGGGGIPSNVASNRRWSTTQMQIKPAFSLSAGGGAAPKKKVGGSGGSKTPSNWETATAAAALMPHFASFSPPPRDWERRDDGHVAIAIARHPYASASAGGEKSFLSVNEKTDKGTGGVELPTFVSFTSSSRTREDGSKAGRLSKHGSPRLSKLDVKVEVIEMKESVLSGSPTPTTTTTTTTDSPPSSSPTSDTTEPQKRYLTSADDVV